MVARTRLNVALYAHVLPVSTVTILPCTSRQSGKLTRKLHHIPLIYYGANMFRSTWPQSGIKEYTPKISRLMHPADFRI